MYRRDFLKSTGAAVTGASLGLAGLTVLLLPGHARAVPVDALSTKLDVGLKKKLATAALDTATKAGATYCDVRIGRYLRQFVITRENKVQNVVNTESTGAGIRVIVNNAWGFAASNDLTLAGIAAATSQAVAIARANSKIQTAPVQLAPNKGIGEVSWATPIKKSPMEVPIKEKVDLLMSVNGAALKAGADYIRSVIFAVNEQKYFASTDGSFIDQDVHRIWSPFQANATRMFRERGSLSAPVGMGYEYLDPKPAGRIALPGGAVVYSASYDMHADAIAAAQQAHQKLTARSVKPGKYDLVLDPSHLWLTIHESVGHATELDRVLGYEANYAGTSFATLDKWRSKDFKYGSPNVTIFADKTQQGTLGAVGYDDEGVKTGRWDLIKDGILVNYHDSRSSPYHRPARLPRLLLRRFM